MATTSSSPHRKGTSGKTAQNKTSSLTGTSNMARAGNWMSSAAKRVGIRRTSNSTPPTGVPLAPRDKNKKRGSKILRTRKTSAEIRRSPLRPVHVTSKPLTSPPNKPLPATPKVEEQSSSQKGSRSIIDAQERVLTRQSPTEPEKIEEWPILRPTAQEKAPEGAESAEAGLAGCGIPADSLARDPPNPPAQAQSQLQSHAASRSPTRDKDLPTIKLVPAVTPPSSSDQRGPLRAAGPNKGNARKNRISLTKESAPPAQSSSISKDSLDLAKKETTTSKRLSLKADDDGTDSIEPARPEGRLIRAAAKLSTPQNLALSAANVATDSAKSDDGANKENEDEIAHIDEQPAVSRGRLTYSTRSGVPVPGQSKKNALQTKSTETRSKRTTRVVADAQGPVKRTTNANGNKSIRSSASTKTRSDDRGSDGTVASTIATSTSGRVSASSEIETAPMGGPSPRTVGQIISDRMKVQANEQLPVPTTDASEEKRAKSKVPLHKNNLSTPVRQFSTKRLSTSSADYGPMLKIYSSAEKVIMGDSEEGARKNRIPRQKVRDGLLRTTTMKLKPFGQNLIGPNRPKSPSHKSNSLAAGGQTATDRGGEEIDTHRDKIAKSNAIKDVKKKSSFTEKIPVPDQQKFCAGSLNPTRLTPVRETSNARFDLKRTAEEDIENEDLIVSRAKITTVADGGVGDPFVDSTSKGGNALCGNLDEMVNHEPYRISPQPSIGPDEATWIAQGAASRGSTLSRAITVSPISSKSLSGGGVSNSPVSSVRVSQGEPKLSIENLTTVEDQKHVLESHDQGHSNAKATVVSQEMALSQEQTPLHSHSKTSNAESTDSSAKSFPTRSSSRVPVPDYTVIRDGDSARQSRKEMSHSPELESSEPRSPCEFAYRQNRLGAEYGLETVAFDPSQPETVNNTRQTSKGGLIKDSSSSLPKSLFNVRGLFQRNPPAESTLLVDKKQHGRATKRPTILRGYPFPRTSEIHPLHRPTKSPGPNDQDPDAEEEEPLSPYKLDLTVPVTRAREDPCEAEIDKLQDMALHMMSRVRQEPRVSRRSDYLDISKIMVDTILNVREAKKAAEEARAASRRAEVAQLLCEKHLQEMTAMTSRIGDEMLRSSW